MRRPSAKRRGRHGDPGSLTSKVRSSPRWWRLTTKHMTTPTLTSAASGCVSQCVVGVNQHKHFNVISENINTSVRYNSATFIQHIIIDNILICTSSCGALSGILTAFQCYESSHKNLFLYNLYSTSTSLPSSRLSIHFCYEIHFLYSICTNFTHSHT